jgi:cytochrome P450
MIGSRSLLRGIEVMHGELGNIFQIPLPGFRPTMLVGPEWARFLYVSGANKFLWRVGRDPVARLLRQGLLVEDGDAHDESRRQIDPSLHRKLLEEYGQAFIRCTDQVTAAWRDGHPVDMLVEMRRVALLTLAATLFGEDFTPYMDELWSHILKMLRYISPGAWIVWPEMPRIGYRRALREVDQYLYGLIQRKRASSSRGTDMITHLIHAGLTDDRIRDHALTMLIAGHDTSTSLLAWTLYLLGQNPEIAQTVQADIDVALGDRPPGKDDLDRLPYLGQVIDESLRLYPPIHLSNRIAAEDIEFNGYRIPGGSRVMLSIYLTHRDPKHWPEPGRFDPDRFDRENNADRLPYTYMPFGGGRRNCIGSAFARAEARIVLARILQRFHVEGKPNHVRPYMGATLEPHPGVWMEPTSRTGSVRVPQELSGAAA